MYQFNREQEKDGSWRFELNGIILIIDGFTVENEQHRIENPEQALAFLTISGNIYGVANQLHPFETAEDFYDFMRQQQAILKKDLSAVTPSKSITHPSHLRQYRA